MVVVAVVVDVVVVGGVVFSVRSVGDIVVDVVGIFCYCSRCCYRCAVLTVLFVALVVVVVTSCL